MRLTGTQPRPRSSEALDGRLGRPRDVTPEAGAVAGPPEGVALAVLLGEHQQDLRRQREERTAGGRPAVFAHAGQMPSDGGSFPNAGRCHRALRIVSVWERIRGEMKEGLYVLCSLPGETHCRHRRLCMWAESEFTMLLLV
ncbi:hypothetical protein EYF80_032790 [Liparis tanakae]|uniref:Uncharacterized protein n=1 Tax=Liparis tanakae TaxID=230148 RepID=A0A4Z2GU76_9TELE|nr:hypothetical protein EYF80_032790 [Liparis tanakae]